MRSFKSKPDNRRKIYLDLVGSVEAQLRDAYAVKHEQGLETQVSLADKLGVSRSAINKRLRGHHNMTLETVADMVWGLGQCIDVKIYDPMIEVTNQKRVVSEHAVACHRPDTKKIKWSSDEVTHSPTTKLSNAPSWQVRREAFSHE